MNEEFAAKLIGKVLLGSLSKLGNQPFRRLCSSMGADGTMGEMAFAERIAAGKHFELALTRRHPEETFFGAQLVGSQPDVMAEAAAIVGALDVDFIELNFACPVNQIVKRGAGATLLKKPKRATEIITAVRQAMKLPLTVKIRSGWSEGHDNAVETARAAQDAGADAIMLHARSRNQHYGGPANWQLIGEVVKAVQIPVVGSGDLFHHFEVEANQAASSCAAVLIGRGALIKPWIFQEIKQRRVLDPSADERWQLMVRYCRYAVEYFGSDEYGLKRVRHFMLPQLDFFTRYVPTGAVDYTQRLQERPPGYTPRSELEALLSNRDPESMQRLGELLLETALQESGTTPTEKE